MKQTWRDRWANSRLRYHLRWLYGERAPSFCPTCAHRLFPNGSCPNVAGDGTHAVDGDGWPE